jgi:outer membrane receptor for ferric coprogen and ferric-rhodotorulic acid
MWNFNTKKMSIASVFVLSICLFFVTFLSYKEEQKSNNTEMNLLFKGVIVEKKHLRGNSIFYKNLETKKINKLAIVKDSLWDLSEVTDTIEKNQIGNQCLLIKKDTTYKLGCFYYDK